MFHSHLQRPKQVVWQLNEKKKKKTKTCSEEGKSERNLSEGQTLIQEFFNPWIGCHKV